MGMVFCRYCGKELHETAPACPHCGALQVVAKGGNKNIAIPDGIKGWSWGAFLLNWIWAIGNRTWIGLLALIPLAGIIMAFVLGFKGREWAWRNKQWQSVEHFNKVQKKWSVLGALLGCGILAIAFIVIPAYRDYVTEARQHSYNSPIESPNTPTREAPSTEAPQIDDDVLKAWTQGFLCGYRTPGAAVDSEYEKCVEKHRNNSSENK